MRCDVLTERIKALPSIAIEEVSDFVDYVCYKYGTQQEYDESTKKIEKLNALVGIIPNTVDLLAEKNERIARQ